MNLVGFFCISEMAETGQTTEGEEEEVFELSPFEVATDGDKGYYASAFTAAGRRKQNEIGTSIKAVTEARLTLNAMAKYFMEIPEPA